MGGTKAYNALLVYPRFNANSFWNYQATCEVIGARYPAPPLGLITVAAMLPQAWGARLVNRNTEDLTEPDWAWADLVLTGGMLPQRPDTLRIIKLAHARGKKVVVGGPDITSNSDHFPEADFRVLGEAESVMEQFISAWDGGAQGGVFEAVKFQADVTKSPVPRFDLLKLRDYANVGVQYSRGCPFVCEFCDIIELFGRVPRTKSAGQMLAELDALYRTGYRGHVDFVDDNFIGNKKALKTLLPELKKWLEAHHYPFEFSTEASINVADDRRLLELMQEANFFYIFVGIESPDTDTLVHMQKKQNTRRSIAESTRKIYRAGMFVVAGFIVGFDSEKASVGDEMVECIEDTAIPVCLVGLLYALSQTQLGRRLLQEGRLYPVGEYITGDEGDQCTAGLNFETLRPRRDAFVDYRTILERIYDPAAYFARLRRVGRELNCSKRRFILTSKNCARDLKATSRIIWRMGVKNAEVRAHFWHTFLDCATHNPRALKDVLTMTALYLHLGPFSKYVSSRLDERIKAIDSGEWKAPRPLPGRVAEHRDSQVERLLATSAAVLEPPTPEDLGARLPGALVR